MYQQQQPPQSQLIEDAKNGVNWFIVFINIYSTAMEVFLHRNMGHRYLGFQAVAVLLVVPLHTLFFRTTAPQDTAWFLLFFVLCCFAQRCNHWDRRKTGVVIHSQYNGYPWLRSQNSRISEVAFKTWVEPALVGFLGLMLRRSDHANGSFLMYCAFAMCAKNLIGRHVVNEEVADMNDNLIEQQFLADRMRHSTDRRSCDYDRSPRG